MSKYRKIIDWKNRPDTCTNGREGYFKINTIQTFPNVGMCDGSVIQ